METHKITSNTRSYTLTHSWKGSYGTPCPTQCRWTLFIFWCCSTTILQRVCFGSESVAGWRPTKRTPLKYRKWMLSDAVSGNAKSAIRIYFPSSLAPIKLWNVNKFVHWAKKKTHFSYFFSSNFSRTEFRWIVWHWRICVLFLPRNGRRVHKLWQSRLFTYRTCVQIGYRWQEYTQPKLGHLLESSSELQHIWRISILFQRNPRRISIADR